MSRPRHLELFAGGCGSAWGWVLAGYDVTAVDIHQRRDLPDSPHLTFIKADALDVLQDTAYLRTFDTRGGSPPCQTETALVELRKAQGKSTTKVNLIPQTRAGFERAGGPYVIENVPRSSVRPDLVLCGSMFGLQTDEARAILAELPVYNEAGNEGNPLRQPNRLRPYVRPRAVCGTCGSDQALMPGGGLAPHKRWIEKPRFGERRYAWCAREAAL